MKIGVVGLNGRMSKVIIEEITNNSDHILSGVLVRNKVDHPTIKLFDNVLELMEGSDALIDFSNPATSIDIARKLVATNKILVCGTTGFSEAEFEEFKSYAINLTSIWSPNMSLGINLLQMLLKIAANKLPKDFDPAIIDIHHVSKLDSPSGTALALADTIKQNAHKEAQISSLRIGGVPGEHQVIFSSKDEAITLTHQAFNRSIFAKGAIKACAWGLGKKPGFYSMQDVLSEQ